MSLRRAKCEEERQRICLFVQAQPAHEEKRNRVSADSQPGAPCEARLRCLGSSRVARGCVDAERNDRQVGAQNRFARPQPFTQILLVTVQYAGYRIADCARRANERVPRR